MGVRTSLAVKAHAAETRRSTHQEVQSANLIANRTRIVSQTCRRGVFHISPCGCGSKNNHLLVPLEPPLPIAGNFYTFGVNPVEMSSVCPDKNRGAQCASLPYLGSRGNSLLLGHGESWACTRMSTTMWLWQQEEFLARPTLGDLPWRLNALYPRS